MVAVFVFPFEVAVSLTVAVSPVVWVVRVTVIGTRLPPLSKQVAPKSSAVTPRNEVAARILSSYFMGSRAYAVHLAYSVKS